MNQANNIIRRTEHVPDTFHREVLQKPQMISTSQLFFHNDLSRRNLLGRNRDIESRHGHSLQFFHPTSNEVVNTCHDSLSGASSLCSAVSSSANVESSSGSFNDLVSSTILYFRWPIAASVPTPRGISFELLFIKRLANGPCMLARLSLQTREPTDALII